MKSRPLKYISVAALCAALVCAPLESAQRPPTETIRVPTFGTVTLYAPAGAAQQVVLFLSGDGGWNLGVIPMAERLRQEGALVAGIDILALTKSLDSSTRCAYPAGALEELSRAVQAHMKLPAYKRPVLVGYSSGATMAYAAIAAAPPETFAGAVSLGFCPDIEVRAPLCQMRGLRATKRKKGVGYDLAPFAGSSVPWTVLHGEQDAVCSLNQTRSFVASTGAARLVTLPKVGHGFGVPARWESEYVKAYRDVVTAGAAKEIARVTTPEVADLSLVEVRPTGNRVTDTMAVILSGDGGWADIDKEIASGLAADGIPVVGWSSLDYYWSPRSPEGASADLARLVNHYTVAWQRPRVLVIGYSFGADVAPFLVNRLPDSVQAHIATLALLAPSDSASFEFHVANWLGASARAGAPTRPERDRLTVPTLCVLPADEPTSACATTNRRVRPETSAAGHHFGGQYAQLVRLIVRGAP